VSDEGSNRQSAVTVLGTGAMGSAVASALVRSGRLVTVWNRSPARAASLEELGARVAATPSEAVSSSPLTISVLLDHEATLEVLDGEVAEQLHGRTLVQFATDTPDEARELGAWAERNGIQFLDAAIATGPRQVGTDEAIISYAGDSATFQQHRETFDALGGEPIHDGDDVARGAAMVQAGIAMFYGVAFGFFQAAALAAADGVSAQDTAAVALRKFPSFANQLQASAAKIDAGEYSFDQADLAVHVPVLEALVLSARRHGVDHSLLSEYLSKAHASVVRGDAKKEFAVVYELFRQVAVPSEPGSVPA
jgi:3-hydroxyisobutyrate dehydrogenase-like beta-hydroxyacid dehydrogenase